MIQQMQILTQTLNTRRPRRDVVRCVYVIQTLRNSGKWARASFWAKDFRGTMIPAMASDAALSATFAKAELPAGAVMRVAADPTGVGAVRCWIRASLVGEGVRLDAMGAANTAIAASYRFQVAKSSLSGSSANMQSGDLVLWPTPRVFSTIALDHSAIGNYNATLSLKWDGGHVSCGAP
jgi:hypothetical protein